MLSYRMLTATPDTRDARGNADGILNSATLVALLAQDDDVYSVKRTCSVAFERMWNDTSAEG